MEKAVLPGCTKTSKKSSPIKDWRGCPAPHGRRSVFDLGGAAFSRSAGIDPVLANVRELGVCGFFLVQRLLQQGGRIAQPKLLGERDQRPIDGHFIMLHLVPTDDESGIAQR